MPTVGAAHRPVAYGHHGLVATAHPLAALAGTEVLRRGGNAVDAALAVNGILTVVQSHMCGLGGDLFALLYDAPSGDGPGIALHCPGAGFSLDPASPNVLAPRKQPFHTLIAALVTRDAAPAAALATMGGHGQPQTHVQVLTNLLDFGMDPQGAIERPRFVPVGCAPPIRTTGCGSRGGCRRGC